MIMVFNIHLIWPRTNILSLVIPLPQQQILMRQTATLLVSILMIHRGMKIMLPIQW